MSDIHKQTKEQASYILSKLEKFILGNQSYTQFVGLITRPIDSRLDTISRLLQEAISKQDMLNYKPFARLVSKQLANYLREEIQLRPHVTRAEAMEIIGVKDDVFRRIENEGYFYPVENLAGNKVVYARVDIEAYLAYKIGNRIKGIVSPY